MRDLASIVTIETKNKMFEKDRICVVTFKELGYEAIVPVEHNVGDRMVFIQEGAILPEIERWEFLRKRCYREDLHGFLIKPMTMGAKDFNGEKGDRVKSWGLCVTLAEAGLDPELKAGTDVTDKLEIRKYEPEEDASPTKQSAMPKFIRFCLNHKLTRWIGKIWLKKKRRSGKQSNFPSEIIQKSDETTIQNYKSVINQFPGTKAFITAKMEGQSFTCSLDKKTKKFYVCSRNNRYDEECEAASQFFAAAKNYDIAKKLKDYYKRTGLILVVQGEQCGPGIQGNIYNLPETKWFVFRMKAITKNDIIEYSYPDMAALAKEILDLDCVPFITTIPDMGEEFKTVNDLVKYAEQQYWTPDNLVYVPKDNEKLWKHYLQHEGIVVKSYNYNKEKGTGFSFKVKNMAYQEKQYTEMHKIASTLK